MGRDLLFEGGEKALWSSFGGGATHGTSVRLGVVDAQPLEVGETEDLLLEGNDVVDGQVVAALWQCGVLLQEVSESCDGWDAGDAGVHIGDVEGHQYVCVWDGVFCKFLLEVYGVLDLVCGFYGDGGEEFINPLELKANIEQKTTSYNLCYQFC